MHKYEKHDKLGRLGCGRFYRFGGILSLLCAAVAGVVSISLPHIAIDPLVLVSISTLVIAVLFVGGMVLMALGAIIDLLNRE